MAEINDLDVTDDSNTARFPEAMRTNAVNNSARALEGILARWHKDINGSAAVSGTDTYTAAINKDTGFALYDGFMFAGDFASANTGAATINLTPDGGSALGAKAIKKSGGTALASGDISAGSKVLLVYDGTNFQMLSQIGNDASGDLTTHIADTTTHGSATALVGVDETQTLTAKTLTAPTINGVVGGTATSQTITTLTTTNVDGILGGNTPADMSATTGSFSGAVTGIAPTGDSNLATKKYVDDLFTGVTGRLSVAVATTANITLSGEQTIDGILTSASLILVKNQTASEENGIYDTAAGAWSRNEWYDTWDEHPGTFVSVQKGTANADTMYICTSDAGGTLDTTAITWTAISPQNIGDMTVATYDAAGVSEQLVGLTAAQTLTTKTISLGSNTISGTTAQFNTALSDGSFATLAGTETLTNKTYDANGTGNVLSNIDIGNAIAASQAEAEAGTDNTKLLTSLRVSQAIAALQSPSVLKQALNGQDNELSRVNLKDYGEITNAIGATGGGTQDIDLTLGNSVSATVDTSANTFTFSNPTASDELCGFTLTLTNGGSQTVNWPASVDWAGATAPTLTAAGVDILVFFTIDGGTIWHGMLSSGDSS